MDPIECQPVQETVTVRAEPVNDVEELQKVQSALVATSKTTGLQLSNLMTNMQTFAQHMHTNLVTLNEKVDKVPDLVKQEVQNVLKHMDPLQRDWSNLKALRIFTSFLLHGGFDTTNALRAVPLIDFVRGPRDQNIYVVLHKGLLPLILTCKEHILEDTKGFVKDFMNQLDHVKPIKGWSPKYMEMIQETFPIKPYANPRSQMVVFPLTVLIKMFHLELQEEARNNALIFGNLPPIHLDIPEDGGKVSVMKGTKTKPDDLKARKTTIREALSTEWENLVELLAKRTVDDREERSYTFTEDDQVMHRFTRVFHWNRPYHRHQLFDAVRSEALYTIRCELKRNDLTEEEHEKKGILSHIGAGFYRKDEEIQSVYELFNVEEDEVREVANQNGTVFAGLSAGGKGAKGLKRRKLE